MQLAAAAAAGQLAQDIASLQAVLDTLNARMSANDIMTGASGTFQDAQTGTQAFSIPGLTLTETQSVLTALLNIFNARMTTASAALAAM